MGIRFSKSIKIGSLLKLNISKSGISATVGKKGASVNIGSKGTYLNLSPTAIGVKGTGLSYRQKLTGGYAALLGATAAKKAKDTKETKEVTTQTTSGSRLTKKGESKQEVTVDTNVIDTYMDLLDKTINIHKYADDVMSKADFDKHVEKMEDGLTKQLNEIAIKGDEDTIENLVSSFMNNVNFKYDVRVNYELEDNILYVDLDLPEIEDLDGEYPYLNKNEIAYKKKTSTELKQEYALTVLSLGIYLSANYFNLSSYIDEVVLSGFTSVRDNNGDLTDKYIYSVKFERNVFEKTSLKDLEDTYAFINQFENRINMSSNYTFKAIKPFEMESVVKTNSLIDEAVLGLKQLGYKDNDINSILNELNNYQYETSSEYLKQALSLLNK